MKSIKNTIISLVIIIVIIITILLLNYYQNNDKKEVELENINQYTQEEKELAQVKSASAFFTAQYCANKYITYVSEKDSESVFNLLHKEYIEENNITKENVLEKVKEIPEQAQLKAEKMYVEEVDDSHNKYYMSGSLVQATSEGDIELNDFSIVVNMDFENMIFSVIPLENGGLFNEEIN